MNEKVKNTTIILLFLLLALVVYMVAFFTSPTAANEKSLSENIRSQADGEIVSLNSLTDFEWDNAYTFAPYTSQKEILQTIGITESKLSLETVSESMVQLIFTKEGEIVCVLLGYPDKLGYYFYYGHNSFDYLVFSSSNRPRFLTKRTDTGQLLLTYIPNA